MNNSIPTNVSPIAFFCAEYAIENTLPIYAGGLGILAGDYVREAGDDGVPLYAIGLFYRGGFAAAGQSPDHELDPQAAGFELLKDDEGEPILVEVNLSDRAIAVRAWSKPYGSARLMLLDTNVEGNSETDRTITHYLYDHDMEIRLLQQLVLGLAGIRFLQHLGVEPGIYHLNEGHMAFIVLGLVLAHMEHHPGLSLEDALSAVRGQVVATKHTILSAAGIKIDEEQFTKFISTFSDKYGIDPHELFLLGTSDTRPHLFSTTQFLLQNAIRANAVSAMHAKFEKAEHRESNLISITNGVYPGRWLAGEWDSISTSSSDQDIWKVKSQLRARLIKHVAEAAGTQLDPDRLTVVWARRITSYKRPGLLISDLAKLGSIVSDPDHPVQFIVSGKASAQDMEAQKIMQSIIRTSQLPEFKGRLAFLPDYNPVTAKFLVQGADVWLNTPIVGQEASGTSGMKAGLNGALQFSTADGWIPEVDWEGTGWILPDEKSSDGLYQIINEQIAPLYYDRIDGISAEWMTRLRKTRQVTSERYTTRRMLSEYIAKLYYPAS